jgi:hypothetical protein
MREVKKNSFFISFIKKIHVFYLKILHTNKDKDKDKDNIKTQHAHTSSSSSQILSTFFFSFLSHGGRPSGLIGRAGGGGSSGVVGRCGGGPSGVVGRGVS